MPSLGQAATAATPFLDPAGTTLAFMLGALVVAGWFLRDRRVRMALGTVGVLLVTYALPFEVSGLALLGGWSIVAVVAFGAERSGIVPPWPDGSAAPSAAHRERRACCSLVWPWSASCRPSSRSATRSCSSSR